MTFFRANQRNGTPLRRFLSIIVALVVTVQYTIAPLLAFAPRLVRAEEPVPDTSAPAVTLVAPESGATIAQSMTLSASASDDTGVASVQFLLDGILIGGPLAVEPYTLEWDSTAVANGDHLFSAEARDAAGNVGTATAVTAMVDNPPPPPPPVPDPPPDPVPDTAPPTVSIANPPAETVLALLVTLSVNVADDIGVVGVQYKLDGAPIGPEITVAPFSYEWDSATVPNGNHVLSAEARDAAGNRTTSENVDIACNNADIANSNSAEIHNTVSADANTGGNSAVGTYDAALCPFYEPSNPACGVVGLTPISTGDARAGVVLATQVNTNVTDITTGSGESNIAITNDNTADLLNDVAATAETGLNSTNNNRESNIATGDANVFTAVMNMVNTSVVGSNFTTLTRDIFDAFVGDIDLVDAILSLFSGGLGAGNMDIHNTSTGSITNNVNVTASTGSNSANDNRGEQRTPTSIATGDINVATNVVNLLNTNIVGANWLFSSINVFGQLYGDVILPGEGVLESLFGTPTTQLTVENDNTAGVVNTVAVNADTGNNSAENNRTTLISTGDISAQTRSISTLNTNIVNANFFNFTPNILGSWTGQEINPWSGSLPNTDVNTEDESSLGVDVSNTARIANNITINASTGLNSTNNNRYSSINTGDIRAATNLVNVANTNIVGSNWFLGNLNLFGTWQGNITYAFPDLTLGLQAPTNANPGETAAYTLSFRNQGRVPGQAVTLVDRLPSNATFVSASDGGIFADGAVTWQLGRLGSLSAPQTVSVVVQLPSDLPFGDTVFLNDAVISTRTPEPQTANNAVSVQTVVQVNPPAPPPPPPAPPTPPPPPITVETSVPAPALAITKTSDAAGIKLPGDQVAFEIAVTNTGNAALTDIRVHDEMPDAAGTLLYTRDFPLDQLAVGQTMEVSYTMIISRDTPAGTYTNSASVTAQYGTTKVSAGPAQSTVRVGVVPSTPNTPSTPTTPITSTTPSATTKKSTPKAGALAVTQFLQAKKKTYQSGDKLKFRLTVTNTGTADVNKVVLNEQFINGKKHTIKWELGTLKKGVGIALTYVLTLAADIRPGTVISRVFADGTGPAKKKIASQRTDLRFSVKKTPKFAQASVAKLVTKGTKPSHQALQGTMMKSGNGGFLFTDASGAAIPAWQYVNLNSLSMVDLLRGSRDSVDRAFVQAYDSGMKLVGKQGKNGIITVQDIIKDLRSAPQFRTLYGNEFALARNPR